MKIPPKRSRLFLPVLLILALLLSQGGIAAADSQASKDVEIPSSAPSSGNEPYFRIWFELNPPAHSKKDFDFKPPTSMPRAPSDLQEFRYLFLGNIDPDLALVIRLTDKAKERRIDPERFAAYLSGQLVPVRNYLSLSERINNVILELCLYDLGKVSKTSFFNYLHRIKISSYRLSPTENTFNYIIELVENYIFSTTEAIDSLFLLKQQVTSGW